MSSNFNCGLQKICPLRLKWVLCSELSGELESLLLLNMPTYGQKRAKNQKHLFYQVLCIHFLLKFIDVVKNIALGSLIV